MLQRGKETLKKFPQNRSVWGEGKRYFNTTWSIRCYENVAGEGENRVAPDPPCWGGMGCLWLGLVVGPCEGMGPGGVSPALLCNPLPAGITPMRLSGWKQQQGLALRGLPAPLPPGTRLFHHKTLCELPGAARKRAGWRGIAIKGLLVGAGRQHDFLRGKQSACCRQCRAGCRFPME